jgi:hypothetical protein
VQKIIIAGVLLKDFTTVVCGPKPKLYSAWFCSYYVGSEQLQLIRDKMENLLKSVLLSNASPRLI